MTDLAIREPTSEQCSANTRFDLGNGQVAYATWWPQMGGYVGKCLVVVGGCFDVYIWHDGQFPFRGEGPRSGQPVKIHLDDPDQWIRFGEQLHDFYDREYGEDEPDD
ncbi:hypothetical protein K1W54_04705 [Micromonospora sp. CPCC 205371]|nr:hypothetical protein [Micromonospora sp. CPCC 205371]